MLTDKMLLFCSSTEATILVVVLRIKKSLLESPS